MKMMKPLQGTDSTSYAKSLGYAGDKPVIVLDGKVISHRSRDWALFCEDLRSKQKRS